MNSIPAFGSIASLIERRLLVNYRIDPEAVARVLPEGMRPELCNGHAVGGICLIRLGALRPAGLPGRLGLRTENAAHRIAVLWDGPDGPVRGVYIPRRDTDSRFTTLAAGRLFPGEQHLAKFEVDEEPDTLSVGFTGRDGGASAAVRVRVADRLRGSELFPDLATASAFFRDAPGAFAARSKGPELDQVDLRAEGWAVSATVLEHVESSFFEDPDRFPPGSAVPDCALLMRDVEAVWQSGPARSARTGIRPAPGAA